jgi:hypothetical protein
MSKCAETFEKEMLALHCFDTTAIAVASLKQGIDMIVKGVQDKINLVIGDLIEPMELYYKHYS